LAGFIILKCSQLDKWDHHTTIYDNIQLYAFLSMFMAAGIKSRTNITVNDLYNSVELEGW
jgi:hypothetical protein